MHKQQFGIQILPSDVHPCIYAQSRDSYVPCAITMGCFDVVFWFVCEVSVLVKMKGCCIGHNESQLSGQVAIASNQMSPVYQRPVCWRSVHTPPRPPTFVNCQCISIDFRYLICSSTSTLEALAESLGSVCSVETTGTL